MPGYHIDRITEDIKREIVAILRELKDPRISGMLTVVKVSVTNDLSYAKVYVSAMEGMEAAKASVKGLTAAQGYIRHELGRRLHLRKCPELRFIADDSIEKGFALCRALLQKGKFAYVKNEADIPPKYNYLFDDIVPMKFTPRFVVAVDVATEGLLGAIQGKYHIDLCIDHHGTNTDYADRLLLDDGAAAASEIIYKVIREMGVPLDKGMANCLYTGISTDTGCFRYASATAESYRIAADLIEAGADNGRINRVMFETKTKTYARLERLALESMRFYLDERVAIITVTQEMYHLTGSNEQETEGLAPLTRQIEGVEVGITIREKPDGTCKASLRTFESVNAAEIAKAFGGGGHPQAAACNLDMDVKTARAKLVEKCGELLV